MAADLVKLIFNDHLSSLQLQKTEAKWSRESEGLRSSVAAGMSTVFEKQPNSRTASVRLS